MIVINKNIKDVYIDIISDAFIKKLFTKCTIISKSIEKQKIIIEVSYKKTLLKKYNNDFFNIFQNMCVCDDVTFYIEENIILYKDRFLICFFIKVKNCKDIPLIPFLDKLSIVFIVEFKEISGFEKVECNIMNTYVDYNLEGKKILQGLSNINNSNNIICEKTYKFENISYDNIDKICNKKNSFSKEYDLTKDIVINFVNILIDDYIKFAFLKKICRFYKNMKVQLCIKKYKE